VLFNVDHDLGNRITGYLVTDSISNSSRVRVSANGDTIAVIDTTEILTSLVIAERHETGRCGFVIDETAVPDIHLRDELEISDADSGVLIYRRAPAALFIAGKMIRLETHVVPLRRIDRVIGQQFCYAYCRTERLGAESMAQMFHLLHGNSLYISGRFLYKTFEAYIEDQFKMICMIHDPFEELAERLLLFRHVARRGHLNARDRLTFTAAIEFAAALALNSDNRLRRHFARIPHEAARPLANPLIRQLTVSNMQDLPRGGALAMALDILASCAVVGLRTEAEQFSMALSALLSASSDIIPTAPRCDAASELAERLRQIPAVHDLLELDIELYTRVAEAFHNAAESLSPTDRTR
jgi:hypothetical protein